MKKKKLDFYAIHPAAFPADHDWLIMTPEERGCYHTLIIFIGCADGSIPFEEKKLAALCNISGKKFAKFWGMFGKKFFLKDGALTHKRVTIEMAKARKSIRQKQLAGRASGKARSAAVERPFNGGATIKPKRNETKTGTKTNTPYVTEGDTLKFYDLCVQKFHLRSNSDQTCFRKIAHYIQGVVEDGNAEAFKEAWEIAKEAKKSGNNPVALFISKMKTDMGYRVK